MPQRHPRADVAPWPEWRSALHAACGASRRAGGLHFRDAPMVGAEAALEEAGREAEAVRASAMYASGGAAGPVDAA